MNFQKIGQNSFCLSWLTYLPPEHSYYAAKKPNSYIGRTCGDSSATAPAEVPETASDMWARVSSDGSSPSSQNTPTYANEQRGAEPTSPAQIADLWAK